MSDKNTLSGAISCCKTDISAEKPNGAPVALDSDLLRAALDELCDKPGDKSADELLQLWLNVRAKAIGAGLSEEAFYYSPINNLFFYVAGYVGSELYRCGRVRRSNVTFGDPLVPAPSCSAPCGTKADVPASDRSSLDVAEFNLCVKIGKIWSRSKSVDVNAAISVLEASILRWSCEIRPNCTNDAIECFLFSVILRRQIGCGAKWLMDTAPRVDRCAALSQLARKLVERNADAADVAVLTGVLLLRTGEIIGIDRASYCIKSLVDTLGRYAAFEYNDICELAF